MGEKENISKMIPFRLYKSIKHIFVFGYFSSTPFFFLTLILFLAFLFKIFYMFMNWVEPLFLFYVLLIIFFIIELFILFLFLLLHLEAYNLFKDKNILKTSEFDKKIKDRNFLKKKEYLRGTVIPEDLSQFLFFSFYQGVIVMERPFWLIKVLWVVFKKAIKNKMGGFDNFYMWRKLYDDMKEKEYIYYPWVVRLNKE